MDTIQADVKNKRLNDAYYSSCYYASRLRVKLTSKNRIPKSSFKQFKSSFDYLYQISNSRKELKPRHNLVSDVKKWLLIKTTTMDYDYIKTGLLLFDEYQQTMNELNMIYDG